jgi:hypothetical protein
LAEVFVERVEEDILDGEQSAVVAVEFSSSLCLSDRIIRDRIITMI